MIHYTCDACKRELDPKEDLRYVVRIEIAAAFDPVVDDEEDDRDHLQEIQDLLEHLQDAQSSQLGDDVYQELRFDLCPECRKRYAKNPLARKPAKVLDYSGMLDVGENEKN
jgi:hypothetical protein